MENYTEQRNPKSMHLDEMTIEEMVQLMNEEDQEVPKAIQAVMPEISKLIMAVTKAFKQEGRLIYLGAGTSGRLGVLDAVECVTTFGVSPDKVIGLIAGGDAAIQDAVEGAEDSKALGQEDLKNINLNEADIVIGIAASGRTPYVVGGLEYAKNIGATTGAITNNLNTEISTIADFPVEVITGPEVLTGSTRLKAGTAQKMVLNMISTISMVKIGKVYENLMVDVKPTNDKLVERSKSIIMQATDCSYEVADEYFNKADKNVKLAIVMILTNFSKEDAKQKLEENKGFIRNI